MFSFYYYFLLLLISLIIQESQCWWDEGHMLVGEIATSFMNIQDIDSIEQLLGSWESDFPNTNEITTATIWADLIKCKKRSSYCPSYALPSIGLMDEWHFSNLPANVNGSAVTDNPLKLFYKSKEGRALNLLEKAFDTFHTTRSKWGANLILRYFLHVWGDIHQPLHSVNGKSVEMPFGDEGGNRYRFQGQCYGTENLHALWDSGMGLYVRNWDYSMDNLRKDLQRKARELVRQYYPTIDDRLDFKNLKNLDYDNLRKYIKGSNLLKYTILESYEIARDKVYSSKIDLTLRPEVKNKIPCPSGEYIQEGKDVINQQLVLGGYRLSILLKHFAHQIRTLGLVQEKTIKRLKKDMKKNRRFSRLRQ